MTKQELKTGMTCEVCKGNRYMVYVNPENEITLIPISSILTIDKDGQVENHVLNLSVDLCLKTNMNNELIEHKLFSHGCEFNEDFDPFQIKKIWHSNSPINLFSFRDEDLIWEL